MGGESDNALLSSFLKNEFRLKHIVLSTIYYQQNKNDHTSRSFLFIIIYLFYN